MPVPAKLPNPMGVDTSREPSNTLENILSKLPWVAILTSGKRRTLIAAHTFYSAPGNLPRDLLEVPQR